MFSVIKQRGATREVETFTEIEKACVTYERFKRRGYSCMVVDESKKKVIYVNWSKGAKAYLNACRNDAN